MWNIPQGATYAPAGYMGDSSKYEYLQVQENRPYPWSFGNKTYYTPNPNYVSAQTADRNKLTTEYQTAYDEAKAANEARYKDILAGYNTRYSTAMTDLQGLGEAEKAEIQRTYAQSGAMAAQQLVNTGLHSTTIAPAVQRQNTRQMQQALALSNEQLRREKLGYTTGMSKERLDFMERREDTYPDSSMYVELMRQLGNTGN